MVSLGENESEVEHFDSQILGDGVGGDDPMDLDFVLNADIRMLCLLLISDLISTTDW